MKTLVFTKAEITGPPVKGFAVGDLTAWKADEKTAASQTLMVAVYLRSP